MPFHPGIVPTGADLLIVVLLLTDSPELDSYPSSPATPSSSSSPASAAVQLSPAAAYAARSWVLPPVGCHLQAPDPRFSVKEEDVDAVVRLLLGTAADEAPFDSSASSSAPGKPPGRTLLQQLPQPKGGDPIPSGSSSVCIVAEPGQAKCALGAGAARRAWDLGGMPGGCFLVDLQARLRV